MRVVVSAGGGACQTNVWVRVACGMCMWLLLLLLYSIIFVHAHQQYSMYDGYIAALG